MSARPKTSKDEIVTAACLLIEEHGVEALSMQHVAEAVDVRAPSLYKRFKDRGALLRAVAGALIEDLRVELKAAIVEGHPRRSLRRMAKVYRAFAKKHPRGYWLIYVGVDTEAEPHASAAAELLGILVSLRGAEQALPAARLLVAFLHGFVSMELSGAFRLGGSVDDAFEFGVNTLVDAL
jgi:AcrR family transcriptional regulator